MNPYEHPALSDSGENSENKPAEKKWYDGPYPEKQAPLYRKPDLTVIRTSGDETTQRDINRYNELSEKIEKMAQRLKGDLSQPHYDFELTDDESEFTLRVKGFEGIIKITKVDDPEHVDIQGIIYDRIVNPGRE